MLKFPIHKVHKTIHLEALDRSDCSVLKPQELDEDV